MALGFSYSGSGGGADFLPIVKFDARAGRFFRVDREDGVSTPHDITRNFKAVFDFENLEVGWISFNAGSAPDFQMVPFGSAFGDRPSDNHKRGIRMAVKLSGECGGDCRELAGTSGAMMKGIDLLHDEYLAGIVNNAGKLPVVVLDDTVPIESGSGQKKSTNYQPVFKIAGWVKRPSGLNDATPQPDKFIQPSMSSPPKSPPSTGSTRAAPPKAKTVAPEDDEDFG
jgi:hypothetical protein